MTRKDMSDSLVIELLTVSTAVILINKQYLRFSIVDFFALLLKYLPCAEYFIGFARPLKLIFQFLYQVFADCTVQCKL